ncbi:MAG: hypothetical protein IPO87_17875 [Flavobacteriales bacterium]|nr:hypothetical protein [Flavobacteriales bacterium]
MSIPYYFFPMQVDGANVYDGGLRNNFPLQRFVQDNKHKPFIGLYLKSGTQKSSFVFMTYSTSLLMVRKCNSGSSP